MIRLHEVLNVMKFLLAVIASILLTACAGPMQLNDLASTRRMGVVSDLGTTFHMSTAGTTAFTNRYAKADTEAWQVNNFAREAVVSYLSRGRPFSAAALDVSRLSNANLSFSDSSPIWEAAKAQGFDRLVAIQAYEQSVFPQMPPGYGLYERFMFGSGTTCIYASLRVAIYDVASRKSLAWDLGDIYPCLRDSVNVFAMKNSFSDYSESEKLTLRQQVEVLLSRVLPATVSRLIPG